LNSKYKFGGFELSALTVNLIIYKSFTDIPRRFLYEAGSAAFLSALISGVISFLFIWFLPLMYKETAASDIFEIAEKYISKTFAEIMGLIISVYLIFSAAVALEGVGFFSIISAYPKAPFIFIGVFFASAALLAVLRGMNGVIRVHSVIVPFVVFMTIILLPAIFRFADFNNLFPLFGRGINSVFSSAFKNISYYFDFILIFLINPFHCKSRDYTRTIRISGGAGILINLFIILSANLILPYPMSSEIKFPLYQIIKSVYFGRFLQRIDGIYLLSTALSGMAFISFAVFLICYVLKKSFSLSKSRPLTPTVTLAVLFLSLLIYKNIFPKILIINDIFSILSVLFIIIIPFFGLKEDKNAI